MLAIDIESKKSQSFNVSLSGQSCDITLEQRGSYLYLWLAVEDKPIVQGVLCLTNVKLVRYTYLGFKGDLFFVDLNKESVNAGPNYLELGTRFLLYYDEGL